MKNKWLYGLWFATLIVALTVIVVSKYGRDTLTSTSAPRAKAEEVQADPPCPPLMKPPGVPVSVECPPPYFDVNGDDQLSPIDALLIINHLNRQEP